MSFIFYVQSVLTLTYEIVAAMQVVYVGIKSVYITFIVRNNIL